MMYNISTKKEENKMKRTVNIEINLSQISNYTLSKLTRDEIYCLGLMTAGIYTYHGALKSRVKGFKTTLKTDTIQYFENDDVRWEVIKIVPRNFKNEYAVRLFNKRLECYEDFYPVLIPTPFFKYTIKRSVENESL